MPLMNGWHDDLGKNFVKHKHPSTYFHPHASEVCQIGGSQELIIYGSYFRMDDSNSPFGSDIFLQDYHRPLLFTYLIVSAALNYGVG
jgi:hypothetical protein